MGYLICKNCEVYYEIDKDINDFDTCENCGEKLNYYDSFDDYYKEAEYYNEVEHLEHSYESEDKSQVFAGYMTQEQFIAVLIDEFKPTKKENLIIIFAFASSVLLFFLLFIIPLNQTYVGIMLMLSFILFGVGLLMVIWKLFKLFGPFWQFWWMIRTIK